MGIYMKFGNVAGDATQHVRSGSETNFLLDILRQGVGENVMATLLGEADWIPLKSFDWGATRKITTRAGNGSSSQARGPVATDLQDVKVDKEVDGTSPELLEKFDKDTKGVDCTIVFVRTGDPAEIYLKYDLKNTLITEIHMSGKDKEDRPTETLTLTFTEIELTAWYAEQNNEAPGPSRYPLSKDGSQQGGGGHHSHGHDHNHGPHH
jgi:type VI protein secretion system component Hcp